jgi:hypothetical protein
MPIVKDWPAGPLPRLPGGPDPAAPIPREPVHGIDLRRYATIAAELAESGVDRAAVLADYALDGTLWIAVERTWALRLATAALQHDLGVIEEYDADYAQAQDALGGPMPPFERYVAVTLELRTTTDPALVLADRGLSLPDWARMQRYWAKRLAKEDELIERFAQLTGAQLAGVKA